MVSTNLPGVFLSAEPLEVAKKQKQNKRMLIELVNEKIVIMC